MRIKLSIFISSFQDRWFRTNMHHFKNNATNYSVTQYVILLLLILALILGNTCIHTVKQPETGIWLLTDGEWYYKDGPVAVSRWLSDGYFIDESGRMVTSEWVYTKTDGTLHHSKEIPLSSMPDIDMTRLSYVGEDGKKIKNRKIYYTPLYFDKNGECRLTIDELSFIEDSNSGLDGLRRYIITDGGYKEYY